MASKDLWMWAVDVVSELDALMSLAAHALNADTAMCRPTLVAYPPPTADGGAADLLPSIVFEAKGLRHPAGAGACFGGRGSSGGWGSGGGWGSSGEWVAGACARVHPPVLVRVLWRGLVAVGVACTAALQASWAVHVQRHQ